MVNRSFGVAEGHSFFDDFPIWDPRQPAIALRFGAFIGNDLVSCIGLRYAQLRLGGMLLPVALIGAVATDVRYQGRGLASEMVSFVTDLADQRKCVGAFLWGSEYALYGRQGFELAGAQYSIPLERLGDWLEAFGAVEASAARPGTGWRNDLMPLLEARPGGLSLNELDQPWLSEHKNVEWRWMERSGRITAYAAVGRGIDLAGYIHEWGGNRGDLAQILTILRDESRGLSLLTSRRALIDLGIAETAVAPESLCLAKRLSASQGLDEAIWNDLWFWGLDGA